ncbi:hypothetical protein [Bacteroides fragilis]|uniref:hypothetical protein n=1 Tax=Bacteroides fragilis TaxID=817 RepID=UPI002457C5FA|nr:hypothetical protein [Bacteroides fragilis]
MSSNGKKEYTLIINGISQRIKEVTKLKDALEDFDKVAKEANATTVKTTKTTKEKVQALTEEEKAAKKIRETIEKTKQVNSDATKEQIKATQALKDATRAATLRAKAETVEANSIEALRIELSQLVDKWKSLDMDGEEFQKVGAQVLETREKLKRAEEAAGDFRRSVGNYEKATAGLEKLSEGIDGASKSSMGLAQSLLGANMLLGMFGQQNEENAEQAAALQKVIALLSIVQQVNTNIVREGIVQNKLGAIMDSVRTTQIKAKTAAEALSTKGTIAATAAQKVFNVVASANPYVLLATALVTVVGALYLFATRAGEARKEQAKLNAELSYTNRLLRQLDRDSELAAAVAEAEGKKEEEVLRIRREAAKERTELAEKAYNEILRNRKATKEQIDEAKQLREEAYKHERDLNDQATIMEVRQRKERADKQEEALKKGIAAQKEAASIEKDAIRNAEDAKIRIISDADERMRKEVENTYDRQREDLKHRLSTETNLTAKSRAAINDQIQSLEIEKGRELEKLKKNQAERLLDLERQVNASIVAVMEEGLDKRLAGINLNYDQQVEALEKELKKEENRTVEAQAKITQLIRNAQEARANEIQAAVAEDAQKRADLELSAVDDMLSKIEQKISKATVREKDGLKLIDVEATRKNLSEVNSALDEYIGNLKAYKASETAAHELALASLKKGTPEYEAEVQRYSRAMEEATRKISDAQDMQKKNTENWKNATVDALKDLFGKISEIAGAAAQAVTSVTDTLNMSLSYEIEALNKQLDALNERYEEAKQQREDDAKNVEDIEARLREATGGTAEALKDQLQDALKARQESAREEQKLAREKETLEAQIARKEKAQKRAELVSNIAQGIANTAQGVTQALATVIWPLNIAVAGIVGAMGAAQVGIMTRQLTKLEKGGEIKGPSHANGGVPIPGTNYEAEGGEFVVNKRSYNANPELIRFINDNPRALTVADFTGFLPGDTAAPVILASSESGEDRIIEAIKGINFSPRVAVTDIIDATNEVTTVQDIAGF